MGLAGEQSAEDIRVYQHSAFSVDASVCIQAHDRAGLERLLGYCARPPVAMDQLGKEGRDLVCRFFGVLSTGHRCGEAVDAQTCEGVAVDPDRATDWDEEA